MNKEDDTTANQGGGGGGSTNRDQILAQFQEITSLDDIDQCQAILESTDWNLDVAMHSYFSGDNHMAPATAHSEHHQQQPVPLPAHRFSSSAEQLHQATETASTSPPKTATTQTNASAPPPPPPPFPNFHDDDEEEAAAAAIAASSNNTSKFLFSHPNNSFLDNKFIGPQHRVRLLTFFVEYKNDLLELHVHDNEPVRRLKELIADKIPVLPVEAQVLRGWRDTLGYKVRDSHLLRELELPRENTLTVLRDDSYKESSKNEDNDLLVVVGSSPSSTSSSLKKRPDSEKAVEFELYIRVINTRQPQQPQQQSEFRLKFDSNTQFIEVKQAVYKLSHMYPSEQEWYPRLPLNNNYIESTEPEASSSSGNNSVFNQMLRTNQVLPVSLTALLEDSNTLDEVRRYVNDLVSQQTATSSSSSGGGIAMAIGGSDSSVINTTTSPSSSSSSTVNSKLTPLSAPTTGEPLFSNRMSFVVTLKQHSTQQTPPFDAQLVSPSTSKKTKVDNDGATTSNLTPKIVNLPSESALDSAIAAEYGALGFNTDDENTSSKHDDSVEHIMVDDDDEHFNEHFLASASGGSSSAAAVKQPLIPDTFEIPGEEVAATNHFHEKFTERYGPMVPLFFIGSLEEAVREAFACPASQRKLLGIYLHSVNSILTNIFCSQTLCHETVCTFLSNNFVVWPWDLSTKHLEQQFFTMCNKLLGSMGTSALQRLRSKLPVFLVVTRVRGSNEIITIIEGDATQEYMMQSLMQAYEMFDASRLNDERDERERDERERIKRDQDQAYQASLDQDKAKRQRQLEQEQAEERKLQAREQRRVDLGRGLPAEPPVGSKGMTTIRFRMPNGDQLQRRFWASDKLQVLLDFAGSHGFFAEECKLLTSWPRRDLTAESAERTLDELKLCPQETLTLEQR